MPPWTAVPVRFRRHAAKLCLARRPRLRPRAPNSKWMDLDWIAAANDYHHRATFFGGEAFPIWTTGYPGYAELSTYVGSPVHLDYATGWHDAILTGDLADFRQLKIDYEGRAWKFGIELLKRAAEESRGKSIPSIGAFGGSGDTLAALRDTNRLLLDVIEQPDLVREADQFLVRLWSQIYDEYYDIIHAVSEGSTSWFPLWAPGKFYATECDFSYMISPQMYRDLFMPVIEEQLRFLDYSVYHVDGISAFVHVPAICELRRLQAIQILPGAGKPSPLHFMDTLKYVQSHGKNLHISISPAEVETALSELSARGLFLETWCDSEDEARDLLNKIKHWSSDQGRA